MDTMPAMPSIPGDRGPARRAREECGQAVVELGGVLVLIALFVAALITVGLAGQISSAIGRSVDAALGGGTRPVSLGPGPAPNGPGAQAAGAGSRSGSSGSGGARGGGQGSQSTPASAAGGQAAGSANRGPQSSRLPSGGQRPYVPPRGAHGRPQPVRGGGFKDAYGNVWKWDPSGHAGPHWDVEHPDGSHTNVAPDGTVIGGRDNFPNKAPKGSGNGGDTAKKAAGGAAIVGGAGAIIWWGAKILSPACGPLAPACAIFG
jgi:hypothetical protein